MRIIRPSVAPQPVMGRTVTTFTRDTFVHFESLPAQIFRHTLQWGVAGRATLVRSRVLDFQRLPDLFGTRRR